MRVFFYEKEISLLRMFENKVAGSVFGSKKDESGSVFVSTRDEVTEGSRTRQMRNFVKCTFVPIARLFV